MLNIAIVGSGPSAIYALARLSKSNRPIAVTVFEQGERAGVGTPYDPATTSVELLANIASVEIPPIGETFIDFLRRQNSATLAALGVDPDGLDERSFYPRVAVGAYYATQMATLTAAAGMRGHVVDIRTCHRVHDIIPAPDGATLAFEAFDGRLETRLFDRIILATGHALPKTSAVVVDDAISDEAQLVGVLGSSLSAIDVAVSLSCSRGTFGDGCYRLADRTTPFQVALMSRGGRLPEADFYCPLPAIPAAGFEHADVVALARDTAPGARLDAVFALFAATLGLLDPAYAEKIGLAHLTPDTFSAAYFADRDSSDPIAWARDNLAATSEDARNRHVVAWKYAILRMHEPFAACLPLLDDVELARFMRGLKPVFVDNYAAVPPRSIERILALHDAGHLTVERLGLDYTLSPSAEGRSVVSYGGRTLLVDRIVDARGQSAAPDAAFPFPTLRLLLTANHGRRQEGSGSAVQVDEQYRLPGGLNPLRHVYCLSLPFLIARQPFVQGLTSAAEMGGVVADAILMSQRASVPSEDGFDIAELADIVAQTSPVFMMSTGQVVLSAK